MIKFTLFSSVYDNVTKNQIEFQTFDRFNAALQAFSTTPGYKPNRGERSKRKSTSLISPALYKKDSTRANANVVEFGGFIMLDVDDNRFGNGDSLEYELCSKYSDVKFICYSTASSTFEHPKFRLVLPLTRWIQYDELMKLIYAVNQKFGDMSDPQTKDLSRMFYLPAQYPNAYSFYFSYDGSSKFLNPDDLMEEYPYNISTTSNYNSKNFIDRLNPALRDMVLQSRRSKLEKSNKTITWSSYLDCPFVNQDQVNEYKTIAYTDGTGRYSMIYKIMCSIAAYAIRLKYPITDYEIVELIRDIDRNCSNRYQHRKLDVEANRAIAWSYKSAY